MRLRGENIVCFAGEDWWYHNPHSKNHLMRVFARQGNRVLFLNSIGFRFPSVGDRSFAYRVGNKLRSLLRRPRWVEPNLLVASPFLLPAYGKPALFALGWRLLLLQIKALFWRYGISQPILWIGMPTAEPLVGHLGEKFVLYHYSDKFTAYDGVPQNVVTLHERLIREADLVVFAGRQLYAAEAHKNRNSVLLQHGVDLAHFGRARQPGRLPPDLRRIPRPIAGFWGELNYSVDQRLLERVARELPQVSFVLLGQVKTDVSRLEALPNVHFLGQKRYEELPEYARGFDVCLIPLTVDHEYDRHRSPIKLREYLATGRPVVSVRYPEVEPFAPHVFLAQTAREFAQAVRLALAPKVARRWRERVNLVRGDSWEVRADEIGGLIARLLAEKAGRRSETRLAAVPTPAEGVV